MQRTATTPNTPHQFMTLDAMRGVAAIMVMLCHFSQHTPQHYFGNADVAVDFFFTLSGFVLAHAYTARLAGGLSIGRFMLIRLIRLYPFYIIGSAVGVFSMVLMRQHGMMTGTGSLPAALLSGLLFLPTFEPLQINTAHGLTSIVVFPFNDPAWSLFFEMFISVAFGIGMWKIGRPVAGAFAALLALLVYAHWQGLGHYGWGVANFAGGFPRVFVSFLLGMAAYRLWLAGWRFKIHSALLIAALFLFLGRPGVPSALFSDPVTLDFYLYIISISICAPLLVLIAAGNEPPESMRLIFSKLGLISYGLYAIHFPLFRLAKLLLIPAAGNALPDSPLWFQAGVAIVCIALAYMLTRFCDVPLRAWLMSLTKKATATA